MSFEIPLFQPAGLVASAVSLATKQFYCVRQSTTDGAVEICDTDGELVLGVVQNKPAAAKAANVMMAGITKIEASETLVAGDHWGTTASGTAKKVEATVTGADVGDYCGGVVLEGAAVGELASVTIGLQTYRVEAQ